MKWIFFISMTLFCSCDSVGQGDLFGDSTSKNQNESRNPEDTKMQTNETRDDTLSTEFGEGFTENTIELYIFAGQSNAQGWMGDAGSYPADPDQIDQTISFHWTFHGSEFASSGWQKLGAQQGRFPQGHFGPEITFARSMSRLGRKVAIFKYSQGSTSLAQDWKRPGQGGIYDQMVSSLNNARSTLNVPEDQKLKIAGFIWIQGESDSANTSISSAYKSNLLALIDHFRDEVVKSESLPIILGVDEAHPWVSVNSDVPDAQKQIAAEDPHIVFSSMDGFEKADTTHLTPQGLERHGVSLYEKMRELTK